MVSITREYNGEEKTFTVADPLLFEVLTPTRSAYAYLQKFTSGHWSTHDVAFVISYALHGPTQKILQFWPIYKHMAKHTGWGGALAQTGSYLPHPDVVRIVSEAPGNFAPIAVDILTELVFGKGASQEAPNE